MIGKTLGTYEILSPLGKGGMGEVWRARDSKLGREVAIKTLPEEFAQDEARLARFEREARLLASLNHPNIATIHGFEDGTRFLVLELVEGDTLADRLKHGAIPVEESLKLALQIAEALEAAHEKGVIHRDLKPANIKVTPEGKVKVLDFGLAKALMGDGSDLHQSHSPTLSMAATAQGVILGTAAYMSPEQAKGLPADKRADVFAFGGVLFEMLTGRQAFRGALASEILASVITQEPDYTTLHGNLHPRIKDLLHRCFEKEPKDRWQAVGDIRVEIAQVLADPAGALPEPVLALSRTGSRPGLPWTAGTALAAAALAALGMWAFQPAPEHPITRFAFESSGLRTPASDSTIALSPDGRRIVYGADGQLHMRAMEQMEATPIPGTEGGFSPFFSPDGESLGFFTATQLKTMVLPAGAPVAVADTSPNGFGGTWGSEDQIIFGQVGSFGLSRVPATGGIPEPFAALGNARDLDFPQILPGGEWVIFTEGVSARWSESNIVAQSVATGDRKLLIAGGHRARYASTGHLVYAREGELLAVGFDAGSVEVVTPPVVLVEGVLTSEAGGGAQFALSDNGTLAYVPGVRSEQDRVLAFVGVDGGIERVNAAPAQYLSPRLSPDGTTLAVQSVEDSGDVIWTYDLSDDRQIRQLTFDGSNSRPIWTPDGERITFASDREGTMSLYWQPADGSAPAERLTTAEDGTSHWPGSWSPDGQVLAFTVLTGKDLEIWTTSPGDEEYEIEPLYALEGRGHMGPEFSPDGEWLTYSSGPVVTAHDIYVEPFPPTGRRERISRDGGYWVFWSRDGSRLFYRALSSTAGNRLRSVDIDTEPVFSFTNERTLGPEGFVVVGFHRDFDITPDGERFVMVFPEDESGAVPYTTINIVMNWFEELKERVPVP